ncbi:MAG: CDP-alcohol phosphatidyltransferase family protein [Coriobacteriia bacterium]|nr:CDP-alcohol phosphatidyltransferase family protein [Coriobacteriia bacterium]
MVVGEPSSAEDKSHEIYTVANSVTLLRLMLVPFFFAVLINGRHDDLAFALFVIAASTDWLDGQIARRTGTVTALGKAIDPLVDRLLLAAGVVGLNVVGRLPLWAVVVLLARDFYLMYGAWRLEQVHVRLPVTYAGKATTAVLLTGFAALLLNWPRIPGLDIVTTRLLPGFGTHSVAVGIWLVYAGIVLSIGTALQYTVQFRRIMRAAEGSASAK